MNSDMVELNGSAPPVLHAQNLCKTYTHKRQITPAVQDVSLALHPGEILAFLGPNGAGKTTTIKMIAGLIRPDQGAVRILGRDPHRDARSLRSVGAILEGNRNLYWRLTPAENLEYFGVLRGLSAKAAAKRGRLLLEKFSLSHKRQTPIKNLSRGMQQKVALAVALVHEPSLLLLDEPTLGLDVEASQTVKELVIDIAKGGCAVLLTTHQLNVAEELSDRVSIIQNGRIIAEDSTKQLIRSFSGSSYVINLEQDPDIERIQAIDALGGVVQGSTVFYTGENQGLYAILDILRPLPLTQVKNDEAGLTAVFLKLINRSQTSSARTLEKND